MNSRDIYGDGHGFRDVPQVTRKPEPEYNFDVGKLPLQTDEPFVGLYVGHGNVREPRLVIRAPHPHRGLRLLSFENQHYMTDPIAWYALPRTPA